MTIPVISLQSSAVAGWQTNRLVRIDILNRMYSTEDVRCSVSFRYKRLGSSFIPLSHDRVFTVYI
jgi:hypothetical protein